MGIQIVVPVVWIFLVIQSQPASSGPIGYRFAAGRSPIGSADQLLLVVFVIESPGERQLFVVAQTGDAGRLGFSLGKRRQKHARQNSDDGNDDQEFNQGESVEPSTIDSPVI